MEKKQFKGWGILVAAFIMSFIPTAVLNNCFALYMNPVCTDLGIAVGSWSLVNLIASLTSAIGAMIGSGGLVVMDEDNDGYIDEQHYDYEPKFCPECGRRMVRK